MEYILETENIIKYFGNIWALDRVNITLEKGQIYGLIGPNGSGKTTLFNAISGFVRINAGSIVFEGKNVVGLKPYEISRLGIRRTFQISRIPNKMTVLENLLLAAQTYQVGESPLNNFLKRRVVLKEEKENLDKANQLLEYIGLAALRNEYSTNLSGGQRKLLSLARVLMINPKLIILDEVTAGVNPKLTTKLLMLIKEIQATSKMTIFLIEHKMNVIYELCHKIIVLAAGRKIAEGTPNEIRQNEDVLKAYLGQTSD